MKLGIAGIDEQQRIPEPLPVDLIDPDQVKDLKHRYRAAQLELGL